MHSYSLLQYCESAWTLHKTFPHICDGDSACLDKATEYVSDKLKEVPVPKEQQQPLENIPYLIF